MMIKIQNLEKQSYLNELTNAEAELAYGGIGFLDAFAWFSLGRAIREFEREFLE